MLFFSEVQPEVRASLVPYTTLFRSHGASGIKTNEGVARTAANGDGLRLDLGSVDVHGELTLDLQVNRGSARREHLHSPGDRKSTRLNSSHANNSYAVLRSKKKKTND